MRKVCCIAERWPNAARPGGRGRYSRMHGGRPSQRLPVCWGRSRGARGASGGLHTALNDPSSVQHSYPSCRGRRRGVVPAVASCRRMMPSASYRRNTSQRLTVEGRAQQLCSHPAGAQGAPGVRQGFAAVPWAPPSAASNCALRKSRSPSSSSLMTASK